MKEKFYVSQIIFLLLLSFLFESCYSITYSPQGIHPVKPDIGLYGVIPKKVDSLQPTLTWKASNDPDVSYDLVVTKTIKGLFNSRQMSGFVFPSDLPIVYYRENIKENYHRVEQLLEPKTEYYWSVRIHHSEEPFSPWSDYSFFACFLPLPAWQWGSHQPYIFRTPKATQKTNTTQKN